MISMLYKADDEWRDRFRISDSTVGFETVKKIY